MIIWKEEVIHQTTRWLLSSFLDLLRLLWTAGVGVTFSAIKEWNGHWSIGGPSEMTCGPHSPATSRYLDDEWTSNPWWKLLQGGFQPHLWDCEDPVCRIAHYELCVHSMWPVLERGQRDKGVLTLNMMPWCAATCPRVPWNGQRSCFCSLLLVGLLVLLTPRVVGGQPKVPWLGRGSSYLLCCHCCLSHDPQLQSGIPRVMKSLLGTPAS